MSNGLKCENAKEKVLKTMKILHFDLEKAKNSNVSLLENILSPVTSQNYPSLKVE
jgi:hypothetical protein